jgi:hypothetical protein
MKDNVKSAVWALCFGTVALQTTVAFGQTAKDLVGTWSFVSITVVDGEKKSEPYGSNVKGILILDGKRFSITIMRDQLPKIASNNRMSATPEENKAIVQGSIAYFGSYTVDESGKAILIKIDASTYPNWTGTNQTRMYQWSGSELVLTNPAGSTGGVLNVRLRRSQ